MVESDSGRSSHCLAEYFEDMEEHPMKEEELMPRPGTFKK